MRGLTPPLAALILVSLSGAAATVIDFSFYPLDAQDCMYQASNSSNCDTETVSATNSCLCSNGGNFVTNTAKCLGGSDPSDLSSVYQTMKQACSDSKTPLSVAESQYMSAAGFTGSLTATQPAATSTTSSAKTAAASTTGPAVTDGEGSSNQNKGLSTGARVGVIAGSSVAGIALLAGLLLFLLRYRKRKDGEESHPMLPQDHGAPIHMLLPTPAETSALDLENSPHMGAGVGEWPKDAKWRPSTTPPPYRNSAFNWETPYDLAYPGLPEDDRPPQTKLAPPPPPPAKFSLARQSQLYELAGSNQLPVEVPGVIPPIEMAGVPVEPPASGMYFGAGWEAANTNYPPQPARRPSR